MIQEIKILVTADTIDLIIEEIKEMNRFAESVRKNFPEKTLDRKIYYDKEFIANNYVLSCRSFHPEVFYHLGLRTAGILRDLMKNHDFKNSH